MVESAGNTKQAELLKGATFWFTGLSGAGKSTLANAIKAKLDNYLGDKNKVFILDGDVIRTGLNKDLGFSAEDRAENIRRICEVSKLFAASGQLVFVAFISPYQKDRTFGREIHDKAGLPFYECHISAPLEVCEERDVKGLYARARAGEIKNFTGITDPYEAPANPDIDVKTHEMSLIESAEYVIARMAADGVLRDNRKGRVAPSLIKEATAEEAKEYEGLKSIEISQEQAEYVQTIGQGWAYPLTGFMNELQLLEVMQMKTITENGNTELFSVPITQDITAEQKEELKEQKKVALKYKGKIVAVIEDLVIYDNRKEEICTRTFGTTSLKHPKVERIMAQGDYLISGANTRFVTNVQWEDGLDNYRMTPKQVNDLMKEKKADCVYAFQVRNPLHNGHVLLLKDTREQLLKKGYKNPILLLHPLGGWTKDDDVPLDTRMKQHQALLDDGTLPAEHTILGVWPSPMYYGGPTEVLWHCSSRVSCGITHFITGRDPAGVKHPETGKDMYDVWHGQKLLVHVKRLLNNVDVLPFKVAAYHKARGEMAFVLPGMDSAEFDFISGTRMRTMAKNNETPPSGFMSPKGWEVLADYYKNL